jgi:hypothetical protein
MTPKFRLQPDGTKDYGDLSSVDPPYQIPMSCSRCRTAWQGCADARDCPECGGDGEGFPEPRATVDAFQRRVVGEVGHFRLETDAEFRERIKRTLEVTRTALAAPCCTPEDHAALRADPARMAAECDYVGEQKLDDEPPFHLWNHRACWSTIHGPAPAKKGSP